MLGESFDPALVAARQGEAWAWTSLYQDLAGQVRGYLAGRGAADPDDLASETFLQVARGIGSFQGGEAEFRSWVFVIAHRRLIDERRAASRGPTVVSGPDADSVLHAMPAESAEDVAMEGHRSVEFSAQLASLTDDQRDVLMLRVIGDFSVRDTAGILGKSEGAIKVLQHRAIAALRKSLSGDA